MNHIRFSDVLEHALRGTPLPCACGAHAELQILTRRPLTAGAAEVDENPPSRPAKLRAARKLA